MLPHFAAHFCCPSEYAAFSFNGAGREPCGFFSFGPDVVCYGAPSAGFVAPGPTAPLFDVRPLVITRKSGVTLPFDAGLVIDNLRFERYAGSMGADAGPESRRRRAWQRSYYAVRGMIPTRIRRWLHKAYFRGWERLAFPGWPVDLTVENLFEGLLLASLEAQGASEMPFIWFWPDGAPYCVLMTHDVETARGRDFCGALMDIDEQFGIPAAFQIVPEERYTITKEFLTAFHQRGFEVNIHDLSHDGLLFSSRQIFVRGAQRINKYAKDMGAKGFRSGSLHRNLEWLDELDLSYDMSVPNTGRLEIQRGGCCTVMPYFIRRILEIPLTTTQDYALFNVLGDFSVELWKKQFEMIAERNGLVSFITHPDYLQEPRAFATYQALLGMISSKRTEQKPWVASPGNVNLWWRERGASRLVLQEGHWQIEGPAKKRGRLAFARWEGDRVAYRIASDSRALERNA